MDPRPLGQFVVDSAAAQQFHAAAAPPQQPAPAKAYAVAPPSAARTDRGSGILTALLVVLLVVAVFYLAVQYRGGLSLGSALASCGWVLYTRPGCPYCVQQMKALGENTYPKQAVCVGGAASASGTMADSRGPYLCKKVPAFPFWVNEYTMAARTGLQDRQQLRRMLKFPGSS